MGTGREVLAYPYRVRSRSDGDARGVVPGGQQAGRLVAVLRAQALASLIHMCVDSVFRDSQLSADLLGAEMLMNQPEAFALSRRQEFDRLSVSLRPPTHDRRLDEDLTAVQRVQASGAI